jgi:chromosome segregation ATPase
VQSRSHSSRPPEITGLYGDLIPVRPNKDYLKRGQKESIRDFINNGREILITQITINDKIEETTHLKEFIESEEEQLREGRRLFEEDKQKFNKYLEHQENKTNEAAEISKQLSEQKQNLMDEMNDINKEIQETETEIRKVEDSLENYISNVDIYNC